MNPAQWFVLIFVLFGLVLCALMTRAFLKNLNKARLIRDTPSAKIRSAPQGYCEISGQGRLHQEITLNTPHGSRPCLWYRVMTERRASGGSNNTWEASHQEQSEHPLWLQDETGECLVLPHLAEINTQYAETFYNAQETERYTQRFLSPDAPLFAVGMFQTHHSIDELAQLGLDPQVLTGLAPKIPLHSVSQLNAGQRPYLVSDRQEKNMIKAYSLRARWALVGSVATLLLSLWLFSSMLHMG